MQEKVQSVPPEITIFEGKPPPQSWLNNNIVKYLQIKGEFDFLTDLKNYVQELQGQKLAASRQMLSIKEEFVSVPDQGEADEIGNRIAYNATQGLIKTEMEYLQKLILLLKSSDPSLSSKLNSFLDELKQAAKNFPKLSDEELNNFSKILEQLTEMSKNLSGQARRAFWKTNLKMLETLMRMNKENIDDLKNETKELQARNKMLDGISKLLQNLQKNLKATPPTGKQFREIIEDLQNLANTYPHLNQTQQQALVNFFQQLGTFKDAKGKGLDQTFADTVVHTKIQEFLKANPNATKEQIIEQMRKFLDNSNLLNSNLPFMKKLGGSIEDILSKPGFPNTEGYVGVSFMSDEKGRFATKGNFTEEVAKGYAPDEESLNGLAQSADKLDQAGKEEKKENENKVNGHERTQGAFKKRQTDFGKAAAGASGESAGSGSLPDMFQRAILGKFMPGQEAFLRALALMLFIDNMGAEAGNALLSNIMDFGEAGDNYDFGNWLRSKNGDFSGSVSEAKEKLNREKAQVSNDMGKAKKGIGTARSELAKINEELKNKNLTPSQRKALIKQRDALKGFIKDLQRCYDQLKDLKHYLDQIKIKPPTGKGHSKSKYFSVSGPKNWQSNISKHEGFVINGNPNLDPPGGLVNVQSDIQAFQQKWSDQSQNDQMILQLRMTAMQQMWTVVGTALQTLNQIYMTLAQGIYK